MRRLVITVDEDAFGGEPNAWTPILGIPFLARSILTALSVVGEVVVLVDGADESLEKRVRGELGRQIARRAAVRLHRRDDLAVLRYLADDLIVVDWRTFLDQRLLEELFVPIDGEVERLGIQLIHSPLIYPQLIRFPSGLSSLPESFFEPELSSSETFEVSRLPTRLRGFDDVPEVADRLILNLCLPASQVGVLRAGFSRLMSLPLTRLLAELGIRSNHVSVFSLVLGLLGGVCAALFGGHGLVIASFAFLTVTLLDRCDGDLARLQHDSSSIGAWLDALADDVAVLSFIVGVSLNLRDLTNERWPLWLGGVAATTTILVFAMLYLRVRLATGSVRRSHYRWAISQRLAGIKGWRALLLRSFRIVLERDVFAVAFCLLALLRLQAPLLFVALGLSSVAFVGVAIELVLVLRTSV
ncbi:MAG: CDP-alcohol phosphatidyltransferase family protein [Myxococcales bacterium]|nr:CDP-alcohol phosphatidyltransferase family protein [Myxococcales bacterium]